MASSMITAITAIVVAVSALVANLVSYRKNQAETEKLKAEAEKLRAEAAEINSKATNAEVIARQAYRTSPVASVIYDGRNGYSLFDFKMAAWDGASGELALDSSPGREDDVLVVARSNTAGYLHVSLESYSYRETSEVIPVAGAPGAARQFRVQCQLRTRQAEETLLIRLKMEGDPAGHYLDERRHRITPGAWVDIDDYFEVTPTANFALRFDDRSVSAAPSRLEIRGLTVTEREPPQRLLPPEP